MVNRKAFPSQNVTIMTPMDAERWQNVKSILERALEIPSDERESFLDNACPDREIRDEVVKFLEFEASSMQLDVSAIEAEMAGRDSGAGPSMIGETVGRYRISGELGVGGMGVVYLAERADGEFIQRVAIKLIKSGISSETVLHRFLTERQILASLKHPNIAHLIDGGTTEDGSPYLVMEYVEGTPINEYAGTKELGFEDRLDLFREVCSAIAFAHQNLVIHRDLKPSNILVTRDGTPKLLDFGIAKILSSDGFGDEQTRQFAFTPEYASPEQILGENLTTATDIYSLGVILYELLTSSRPLSFDGKSIGEMVRSVTRSEIVRPSAAAREKREGQAGDILRFAARLKGDLDNIVLKALNKEPERRYSSVEQFSEDIRRHLAGLPVIARQDTILYRAEKFARRNPLVVGSAALTLVILLSGIIATGYQARRANIERERAELRFDQVRTLANSFIFEINDEIEKSPIKARELVVSRAIEYLDKLAAEANTDAGLESELAAAYEKIGDVQTEIFKPNLGDAGGALESHRKALKLRSELFQQNVKNTQRGIELARSFQKVGNILYVTGDIVQAADAYNKSVELSRSLADSDPDNIEVKKQLSRSYIMLGQSVLRSGSLARCLDLYERSFEINSDLLRANPTDIELQRQQSIAYDYIGYVRMLMGDHDRALSDYQNSLSIFQRLSDANPGDLRFRSYLASGYLFLGIGYREAGRHAEALPNVRRALEIQQQIFDMDKQNFGERNALADCYVDLAVTVMKAGKPRDSLKYFTAAIENYSVVAENDTNDFAARRQISLSRRLMAESLLKSGRRAESLAIFQQARNEFSGLTIRDPNNLEWKYDLAICDLNIGKEFTSQVGTKAVREYLNNSISILEGLAAISPENIYYKETLDEARSVSFRTAAVRSRDLRDQSL